VTILSVPLDAIVVPAPAKLNLWLEVFDRGEDGFHRIDSLMVAIDTSDTVAVRILAPEGNAARVSLRIVHAEQGEDAQDDGVPAGEDNLAWRGALLALERLGSTAQIEVLLQKRIPARAGLGGGSSDAAAAFRATVQACLGGGNDAAANEDLAQLGSDCPFFVRAQESGFARCGGRGERVEVLGAPAQVWHAVVLTPDVGCSTADVYAAHAAANTERDDAGRALDSPARFLEGSEDEVRARLFNRLESAALRTFPGLEVWRSLLDVKGGRHFRLAGSGSSFFGLYGDHEEAGSELIRLREVLQDNGLRPRAAFQSVLASAVNPPTSWKVQFGANSPA